MLETAWESRWLPDTLKNKSSGRSKWWTARGFHIDKNAGLYQWSEAGRHSGFWWLIKQSEVIDEVNYLKLLPKAITSRTLKTEYWTNLIIKFANEINKTSEVNLKRFTTETQKFCETILKFCETILLSPGKRKQTRQIPSSITLDVKGKADKAKEVKRPRAQGGCLGTKSRRKTW